MISVSVQVKLTCRVGNVRGRYLFESILNVNELLHRGHVWQHVKMSMVAPTKAFMAYNTLKKILIAFLFDREIF